MDKTIQELVKSCRPYVSKRTQFLHWDGPYEKKHDTIPLYENFCYALALMRLKEKESYLEGKELYERLLAFQVGDTFPACLHEFPKCYSKKDFSKVLRAFSSLPAVDYSPLIPFWSPFRHYLKDKNPLHQEGFEVKRTLMDQTLAYVHNLPPTKLSPEYLSLALVHPDELVPSQESASPIWIQGNQEIKQPAYTLFWKGKKLEAFSIFTSGNLSMSDNVFTLSLPPAAVQDENELVFYISRDIHPVFKSQGKRVTAFTLDHPLEIETDSMHLKLQFDPKGTKDAFYGHIAFSNRPNQLLNDGESYDYSIAIRTIRRDGPATLNFQLT